MTRCFLVVLLLASSAALAAEPQVKPEDLPRIKPTEPADAVKTFRVRPGFHIELAAAEPLVVDPIAMCFDENGRLFVVEMRDYSERRAEKLGRIRLLEDTNNDGVFDKSTIFLDHLPWPTALFCSNGGLLVGACPDILYAKDTNNDGVADEVQTLFTGFGNTQEKLNVQGLFNNFIWGIDNRIHGCSGHDGGLVQRIASNNPPLDVRNKGFVINSRTWSMTTESGGGQYGLSFDPWGNLFTCSNSSHIETFMYDASYAARNPNYAPPDPRIAIAADGPAAEVFRISPEEPWRILRTRWRIAGIVGGPIEGGGRSAGYFTGATGITIYKGNAYGPDYLGDAFIGDAGGNLVHHKHIRRDALQPLAERPADERTSEFCASTDTWFRPVDFANAPDGCLYIADMYREVIEHPWSIPPSIKKYLDLNSGNDRGRIYRLVPDNFHQPNPPRLAAASILDLVATLEHPNAWHRETAARLLFERQDQSAIPLLEKLAATSSSPFARMHALYALDGLSALKESHLLKALPDADPTVRAHAIKRAERFIQNGKLSPDLWTKLTERSEDPDIHVRYQLVFTLGQITDPARIDFLANILRQNITDPWIQVAVLTSTNNDPAALFAKVSPLLPSSGTPGEGRVRASATKTFLTHLAGLAGPDPSAAAAIIKTISNETADRAFTFTIARALAEGADRGSALSQIRPRLTGFLDRARSAAADNSLPTPTRRAAIDLLAFADYSDAAPGLFAALRDPLPSIQLAAISALDRFDQPEIADQLLKLLKDASPRLRADISAALVKRPARAQRLLESIHSGSLKQSDLDASQIDLLLNSKDDAVRSLARTTLTPPSTQRSEIVESFRPALSLPGDASRGHSIYQQRCISCHRANNEGSPLGPDLVTVKNSGSEKLLLAILDPNREVAPNYISFVIETKDNQTLLGIITADTPAAITLRQAYGRESTIPRSNIKHMTSQKKSLMPEGLEQGLSPQQMSDLLQFISSL